MFPTSYAESRAQFTRLAREAGAHVEQLPLRLSRQQTRFRHEHAQAAPAPAGHAARDEEAAEVRVEQVDVSLPPPSPARDSDEQRPVEDDPGAGDEYLLGALQEPLSITAAIFGELERPTRVFIHSSGTHGVEGFAGAAIQLSMLRPPVRPADGDVGDAGPAHDDVLHALTHLPEGVQVVFLHAVNPFGMSWLRRWNENMVDLNRNFLEDDASVDAHPLYAKFHNLMSSQQGCLYCCECLDVRAAWYSWYYGQGNLAKALAMGQGEYEDGLFYCGSGREQSTELVLDVLSRHGIRVDNPVLRDVFIVDVHTGLGEHGVGSLIVGAESDAMLREMLDTDDAQKRAIRTPEDTYLARGALKEGVLSLLGLRDHPQLERVVGCTQEFGTEPQWDVLKALRAENIVFQHEPTTMTHEHPTRIKVRSMFDPDSDEWRGSVLAQGRATFACFLDLLVRGHDSID